MGMTATERLRALLDERGVEWEDMSIRPYVCTSWRDPDGEPCTALEGADDIPDGKLSAQALLTPEQAIAATLGDTDATGARQRDAVEVVRCRDCKHGHITINGESCKWCDLIATHDIDGNEPNNGYDPEPYFDADFFCAWGRRADG